MRARAGVALSLLLAGGLLAASAAAAEPECIARCRDMATRGKLRAGVTQEACVTTVCQEDGRHLWATGEYDAALASLDAVADRLANSPSFHVDRGLVYYALGRFDAALAEFDTSLEIFSQGFPAAAQRGHTLLRLHRFDEARAQFARLLELKGGEAEFRGVRTRSYLLGNVGVADVLKGDTRKGAGELREALEVDGSNAQAALFVHRVLPQLDAGAIDREGVFALVAASEDLGQGNRKRAEADIATVISDNPKFPEAYFLMAQILRNSHRYEDCERVLLGGERAIPKNVDLKAERLRCTLLRVGPTSSAAKPALTELKSLSSANPDNALLKEILHALDLY